MKWKVNTLACLASDSMPDATVNYLKGFPELQKEAQEKVKLVMACEEMYKALKYIAEWDSFKDHPIGRMAIDVLKENGLIK